MNKRLIIPALIVVVLVVMAGFLAARKGSEHPDEKNISQSAVPKLIEDQQPAPTPPVATGTIQPPAATPPAAADKSQAHFSSGEEADGVDTQVFEISYDGNAYTPSTLNIKSGDIVVFKNKSKDTFWPASNPHPLHTDYPEFDPKKPVAAGQMYQFKFLKVGVWKFHDHLNPTARGVVTVTK